MCGKEVPRLRKVQVGGSVLDVCGECARFGEDVPREDKPQAEPAYGPGHGAVAPSPPRSAPRGRPRDVLTRGGEELAEDYPKRIKNARQKQGLKQEELAKRLNEKKSVISRLETGEIRPDMKLVKKLEKLLGIKLMERMEFQVDTSRGQTASKGVTLGDLIRREK
jgi:putative transcription factor